MKRIDEIKVVRQKRFWQKRMEKAKAQQLKTVEKELEKHVDLIEDETIKGIVLDKIAEGRKLQKEKNDKMRKKEESESEEEEEMEVEIVKPKKRANKPKPKAETVN